MNLLRLWAGFKIKIENMYSLKSDLDFARDLIKGRIAEVIFERMFKSSSHHFQVLRLGYEYTVPDLAWYRDSVKLPDVVKDFSGTPDFLLIADDKVGKKGAYVIEAKFRSRLDMQELKEISEHLVQKWSHPYLFVASPEKFLFAPCHKVKKQEWEQLEAWGISRECQNGFLKLLKKFEHVDTD